MLLKASLNAERCTLYAEPTLSAEPKPPASLTTRHALDLILKSLNYEPTIVATGFLCREAHVARDRNENFYMIGSMGQASSIGLGIALCKPARKVVVLDGDGAVLMNLGLLPLVGMLAPRNFLHIVLDNETYASTGGQRTCARESSLAAIARASGYRTVRLIRTKNTLKKCLGSIKREAGPVFWQIKVKQDARPIAPRIPMPPEALTERLRKVLDGKTNS